MSAEYCTLNSLIVGDTNWVIKVQIIHKDLNLKKYSSGNYFRFIILDQESNEAEVIVFNNISIWNTINVNGVYTISNGKVGVARHGFNYLQSLINILLNQVK